MIWSLAIILLPAFGFVLNLALAKKFNYISSSIIGVLPVLASFIIYLIFLILNQQAYNGLREHWFYWLNLDWLQIAGKDLKIAVAFYFDSLSILMGLIVLGIGSIIHIYSIGYMKGDGDINRFFSYMNIFIFFMLLLIWGENLLITFIGWEGVGLASYLLIGFYTNKDEAKNAASKAFIMNRFGDYGYIIAMAFILFGFGTLDYNTINSLPLGSSSVLFYSVPAMFIYWAACGKSAQFPLFTWLPDAMAGPTPVSALIHAATMVTSGIYLIARLHPLFSSIGLLLNNIILYNSLFTAILAAIIAIKQTDIKKVLAYSTVSQLSFMFMALSSLNYSTAIFHLTTHAFFKALLFLGAGAVILQMHHQQEMKNYGGLYFKSKFSFFILLIGSWALAGLPLGAGFFSKDEILNGLASYDKTAWVLASFASLLTAFYSFRMIYLTFFNRNPDSHEVHSLPKSVKFSLILLAIGTLVIGFSQFEPLGLHQFSSYLSQAIQTKDIAFDTSAMVLAIIIAIIGVAVAHAIYFNSGNGSKISNDNTIGNGFYLDEVYSLVLGGPLKKLSANLFLSFFEVLFYYGPMLAANGLMEFFRCGILKLQKGLAIDYILALIICLTIAIGFIFYTVL